MIAKEIANTYTAILKNELIEATGCTEPIALALAGAKMRETLGQLPEKTEVQCSGNIIKNVKSVVVPNSGGQKGINAAVLLGIIAGDAQAQLQVISKVTEEQRNQLVNELQKNNVRCTLAENVPTLYIKVTGTAGAESASVEIQQYHTNITEITKNGAVIYSKPLVAQQPTGGPDKSLLNVKDIIEYAKTVDLETVKPIIQKQIDDNTAIAAEGLKNQYGEQIGCTLLERPDATDVLVRARAKAAAGSDARMNGCPMAVVINSGSGNQGLTVSLPVIEYAKEVKASPEKLIRALVMANLIAVHQKRYIGALSAYCGAVSAAAGAGCGICWLLGGSYEEITATLTNTIATVGGMVCDGAKSSCAGKISIAVETALQSMLMAFKNRQYQPGEGMVKKNPEDTVKAYGKMACDGMKSTDAEILNIMLEDQNA